MSRPRTPRGMAELSGFRLSSPDSVFGDAITPSLFADDLADLTPLHPCSCDSVAGFHLLTDQHPGDD